MLKTKSQIDLNLGLEYYSTDFNGVFGKARTLPHDFIVEEVALDGSIAYTSLSDEKVVEVYWGGREYAVFILEKCYKETLSTISLLKKIAKEEVGFSGIKDKRALTSQFITIPSTAKEKLLDINLGFTLRFIGFSRYQLRRGMLRGNQFTIVVRDVKHKDLKSLEHWLSQALTAISLNGLIGYYGYQRFGTTRPITHLVGKHIIRGEEEQAVDLILKTSYDYECLESKIIRQLIEKGALRQASKLFFSSSYERAILNAMLEQGNQHQALKCIPKKLKQLFIHGYQAYLFNKALSKLIEERGSLSEVKPGDVVGMLSSWGEATQFIRVTEANKDKMSKLVSEHKASLVMPIPGSKLKTSEYLREVMEKEGVKLNDFKKLKVKGGFRQCLAYPHIAYFKVSEDYMSTTGLSYTIKFYLPKGFYATMLLRELIKPQNPCECNL